MAKTNYTKVEEALEEGLRRMEAGRLLEIADETSQNIKKIGTSKTPLQNEQKLLLTALRYDLKHLHKLGRDPFAKSSFHKDEVIEFLKHPDTISQEQWKKIEAFKKHVSDFKTALEHGTPESKNEELIEKQRKEQRNRRFNVNDKWLPLS
ncbi:MAG: hypothetical protein WCF65_00060 [Parachlamydiaceae bacterium]